MLMMASLTPVEDEDGGIEVGNDESEELNVVGAAVRMIIMNGAMPVN